MTDRDEKGRLLPGHKGSNQYSKQDTQSEPDTDTDATLDSSFDDDLIAAAESYGKPRSKVGRRAWCENLRDERPVEFAALLRPALARKAEAAAIPTGGGPGVNITFDSVPPGTFYNPQTRCLEELSTVKAAWEEMKGLKLDEPPASLPPVKPVLVHETSSTIPNLLDKSQTVKDFIPNNNPDNEIQFGGSDDDDEPEPPRPRDRGVDMNDMLRSIPKPKWRKPDW